MLLGELKDPRVADVTIVDVRTSPDGSHARVYVRTPEAVDVQDAIAGLEHARGFIRGRLGRTLHLRKIPEFHFEADRTLERASRIDELLEQARETSAPACDPGDD